MAAENTGYILLTLDYVDNMLDKRGPYREEHLAGAQKAFEETLRDRFQVMLSQPRLPTVLGSVMLALREDGVEITDDLVNQLDATYRNVDELTKD